MFGAENLNLSQIYLNFKVIVFSINFMFRVRPDSYLVSSKAKILSQDGVRVELSEPLVDGVGADVDSGVVPVNDSFLWIEVEEEEGLIELGECISDLDGRLLIF